MVRKWARRRLRQDGLTALAAVGNGGLAVTMLGRVALVIKRFTPP